jgi:hypothetical protein
MPGDLPMPSIRIHAGSREQGTLRLRVAFPCGAVVRRLQLHWTKRIRIMKISVRSPRASAFAERLINTVRPAVWNRADGIGQAGSSGSSMRADSWWDSQ